MQKDIIEKIEQDFAEPELVLRILESVESKSGEVLPDRICRSMIYLARGDIERLTHYIELFFQDYRDLLWQAEYEDPEVHKYDFNRTFYELGLIMPGEYKQPGSK